MIKGMRAVLYTANPKELRAFVRERLGFLGTDVGEGWLIFEVPEADLACHPSKKTYHEMSFHSDDFHKTVSDVNQRGVGFTSDVREAEWGLMTTMRMPG